MFFCWLQDNHLMQMSSNQTIASHCTIFCSLHSWGVSARWIWSRHLPSTWHWHCWFAIFTFSNVAGAKWLEMPLRCWAEFVELWESICASMGDISSTMEVLSGRNVSRHFTCTSHATSIQKHDGHGWLNPASIQKSFLHPKNKNRWKPP